VLGTMDIHAITRKRHYERAFQNRMDRCYMTRSGAVRRSVPVVSTVTLRLLRSDSEASPVIHTSKGLISVWFPRNWLNLFVGPAHAPYLSTV